MKWKMVSSINEIRIFFKVLMCAFSRGYEGLLIPMDNFNYCLTALVVLK